MTAIYADYYKLLNVCGYQAHTEKTSGIVEKALVKRLLCAARQLLLMQFK